ncbi:MAG: hypothetical protein E7649_07660 [Ruminococcaceae bacterium]|nr:hypothetical protein [Oscillospiraceae bacterium]
MKSLYNDQKKQGSGCISWLLGTALVIVGVVVYAVISSFINRWFLSARFGDLAACALLPLSLTGLTVAFVLYEAIFIVRLVKFGNDADNAKAKRVSMIVTVASIALSLVFAVFSANTFTKLSEDSISKVCFVQTKSYQWNERCDVQRYALSCDANGTLSFSVTMKDGERIELWGEVNSCSQAFTDKYGNLYCYAAYLSEQFGQSQYIIESTVTGVEHMQKHYRDTNSEIWPQLERIIAASASQTQ